MINTQIIVMNEWIKYITEIYNTDGCYTLQESKKHPLVKIITHVNISISAAEVEDTIRKIRIANR